ncbi:MAG: hypothetical protein SVS15_05910, partial [Thermodesulfobacteriota bacterium]|nr:hypothetical protein [Thermodesulfobacteriota bacterium]
VEAAVKRARHELKQKEFLRDVKIKAGDDAYSLPFLPDVLIPNTPENEEKWRFFLETLAPKTRISEDLETKSVGIPYRDGVWLGDLVFAEDVTSFYIVEDVSRIMGRVIAHGATALNKRFRHKITIEKDLEIHCGLLRGEPLSVTLGGDMTLFGAKSFEAVQAAPKRLMRWGLTHGKILRVRKNSYTFLIQDAKRLKEYVLKGRNVHGSYEWVSGRWIFTEEVTIPPELFAQIHSKLNKICLHLGLGSDFIAGTVAKIGADIDKINTYLEFCLREHGKEGDSWGDAFEEPAVRALVENLDALKALLGGGDVDQDRVTGKLGQIKDADLDKAVVYASRPRKKINVHKIKHDLGLLDRLLDAEIDVRALLGDGVNAASFLYSTFRSKDSRHGLSLVLKSLAEALAPLAGTLDTGESMDMGGLLADPRGVTRKFREILPKGYEYILERLEADLLDLGRTAPKELARKIIHISSPSMDPDFVHDMKLLQNFFTLEKSDINGLGLDSVQMLDFLVPKFQSMAAEEIRAVRRHVKENTEAQNPGIANMAARIRDFSSRELVAYLRKRFLFYLAVVDKYNELSKTESEVPLEQEEKVTQKESGLSPKLARAVLTRLNRLCLILGLGKGFIEQHESSLKENLKRLRFFLALCLGAFGAKAETAFSGEDKEKIQDLDGKFRAFQATVAGDQAAENPEAVLESMPDAYFRKIQAVLAKPREKRDQRDIKNDLRFLQTLEEDFLTLEKIFGSSGKLLLFLNSALESKDMERAVSGLLQPLHAAFSSLAPSVKVQDFLKQPERVLASFKDPKDPMPGPMLKMVEKELREIQDKSIHETLTLIRNTKPKTESGELARDFEVLDHLLEFERGAFGGLRLDAKKTVVLLLLNLESFISEELRAMYKADAFGEKTSKQILDAALEKLKWHSSIIQAHNALASLPAPR